MALGKRSPASAVTEPEPNGGTAAVVAVLAIAVFMSSLDLFIVNLAFPSIGEEYAGAELGSLSWILNAYTIVFAAVLVPAGRWADRVGRRRALVAGLAVFTGGSLLCGLAPGVGWLVAARTVQAVGAGVMVPASLSLLLAVVPQEQRARALGSWSALGALGAALGPVIGGALVEIGWRWVFWVNLPVGVVAILLALRLVPESRDEARGSRPDLLGAMFLALAVGLVAGALVEASDWGWASVRRPGPAAGGSPVHGSGRGRARSVIRRRCWSRACSGPGCSPAPGRRRCSTTRPSAPSSSTRSSSSPRSGATRRWRRGWPSPRGR